MPKLSVIIPVYNTEQYLGECLDSIRNQTLQDIEIICINDGSTDDSLVILEQAATEDKRIKVYSQANQGPSSARNVGLDIASGTYLYFMDSDDTLEPNALGLLYSKATDESLDMLIFDGKSLFEPDVDLADEKTEYFKTAYTRSRAIDGILSGPQMFCTLTQHGDYSVSNCLYILKRQFVNEVHLRFIDGVLHEDNAFYFDAILQAKRTSHLHEPLFNRRVRTSSIMTKEVTFQNCYGFFACAMHMFETYSRIQAKLEFEQRSLALERIAIVFQTSVDRYKKLSLSERKKADNLAEERKAFWILVQQPVEHEEDISSQLNQHKKELGRLKESKLYRMGRAFCVPLRAFKKLLTKQE